MALTEEEQQFFTAECQRYSGDIEPALAPIQSLLLRMAAEDALLAIHALMITVAGLFSAAEKDIEKTRANRKGH